MRTSGWEGVSRSAIRDTLPRVVSCEPQAAHRSIHGETAMIVPDTGFGLTCGHIGFGADPVPLTASDFETIRAAKRTLLVAMGVEEKLDIALENHADVERHLLELALEASLF